jgi:hypothetical protein
MSMNDTGQKSDNRPRNEVSTPTADIDDSTVGPGGQESTKKCHCDEAEGRRGNLINHSSLIIHYWSRGKRELAPHKPQTAPFTHYTIAVTLPTKFDKKTEFQSYGASPGYLRLSNPQITI